MANIHLTRDSSSLTIKEMCMSTTVLFSCTGWAEIRKREGLNCGEDVEMDLLLPSCGACKQA